MSYIKIKNWDKFQQYKDRDPKWIKVYRDLTDNYEFSQLPDASKGHLLGLWLLAAKLDNKIPSDPSWIGKRISATSKINLKSLESAGFIDLYKTVQNDTDNADSMFPRGEEEGEKKREEKSKKFVKPTVKEVADYGKEIGFKIDAQYFVDYYESNGWIVGKNKMKDWQATIRNWQRRDDSPQDPKKKPKEDFTRYEEEIRQQIGNFKKISDYAGAVLDKYKDVRGFEPDNVAIKEWRKKYGSKNDVS